MLYNSTFLQTAMSKKIYEQSPCPNIDLLSCKTKKTENYQLLLLVFFPV